MKSALLPDIAAQAPLQTSPLDWVGMRGIALPVYFGGQRTNARVDAGVSLDDAEARGIHMSRLYLALEALERSPLTPMLIHETLQGFLQTHSDLSQRAYLNIHLDHLIKRPALVSPLAGWKSYPVSVLAKLEAQVFHVELKFDVMYSSTCPCSAALARQLIQRQFRQDFDADQVASESVMQWLGTAQGIVATPHSQRSTASISVELANSMVAFPFPELVDQVEDALGTAVQTAVKGPTSKRSRWRTGRT